MIRRRIQEARRARRGRSRVPFNFFLDKIEIADILLGKIYDRTNDPKLLREARGQFLTSSVTAFESYFRDTLRRKIDQGKININKIPDIEKRKISLSDLEWIRKKRVTIGEIASLEYSFTKLQDVDKVFSCAISKDFISTLKQHAIKCTEHGEHKLRDDVYEKIDKLIRLRHKFVHEVDFKSKYPKREIDDMVDALVDFVLFADDLMEHH